MFGAGTAPYFDSLPELSGLDASEARRILTSAYADVIAAREGADRIDPDTLPTVRHRLRRLASGLEAHAVLAPELTRDRRDASCFVAAEALSILGELPTTDLEDDDEPRPFRLASEEGMRLIECGLLYVTAGFDSNAAVVATAAGRLSGPVDPTGEAFWAERCFRSINAFLQLFPAAPIVRQAEPEFASSPEESPDMRAIQELYRRLGVATTDHLRWLSFQTQHDETPSLERVRAISDLLRSNPSSRYGGPALIAALLEPAIEATAERALRGVLGPDTPVYHNYVRERAFQRPLIWPSTAQYARACLPGPSANAVVALPTGSGKSFTAEIAVAQALEQGWVLYLVPTNALAGQVRRDLTNDLRGFEGATVRAFLGDGQYTELSEETVGDVSQGSVLVMTPEKCALALRRSPEAFEHLRLCVFDECHQLAERGGRGAIAELVISHVMSLATECRLLLLSALVENPEKLAEWLEGVSGRTTVPINNPWRPTRTLRAIVGFDQPSSDEPSREAHQSLAGAAERRKNWEFDAPYAVLANLQGPWSDTSVENFVTLLLPITGKLRWHRDWAGTAWNYEIEAPDGYVNGVTGDLAEFLAKAGEQVLAFLPSSRHHPFSVASRLNLEDGAESHFSEGDDPRIDALLAVSDWELGSKTVLRQLLKNGVAVHTSSTIEAERQASEAAFRSDKARVMLATGTLAQGLNLPATVVLIGGTDVGDRRASRTPEGKTRSLAQLVNAIGRAGRPHVSLRSTAIVVPSQPMWINEGGQDIQNGLAQAEVLTREDAAITVSSSLESLVSAALDDRMTSDGMSLDEMTAFTYLPMEGSEPSAEAILSKSLGVWQRRPEEVIATSQTVARALAELGGTYLENADAPEWVAPVSYRSGLPLPQVFALYHAVEGLLSQPRETLGEWINLFGEIMLRMPPHLGRAMITADRLPAGAKFSRLKDGDLNSGQWQEGCAELFSTFNMYVAGASIQAIAREAFGISDQAVSTERGDGTKPIPKTIGLLDRIAYGLSMVGGGLAALFGAASEADNPASSSDWQLTANSQTSLEQLPLAIRNGCGDRDSLAWFRFGLRHRRTAHLLASVAPIPQEVMSDADIEEWVSARKTSWAAQELELELPPEHEEGSTEALLAARALIAGELASSG